MRIKPDPTRAQLWHTDLGEKFDFRTRQRIIYPDGRAEWLVHSRVTVNGELAIGDFWNEQPCWHKIGMTMEEAIKAMKKYDKSECRKTYFLGNI